MSFRSCSLYRSSRISLPVPPVDSLFTNVHVPPCLPPVSRPSPPHDARISSTPRRSHAPETERGARTVTRRACLVIITPSERASEAHFATLDTAAGNVRVRLEVVHGLAGWLAARTCNASRKTLRFRFKNTTQKCTCARPSERGFERPSIKFPYEFPNSAMDSSACPRRSLSAPKTRWQCEKKRIELLST